MSLHLAISPPADDNLRIVLGGRLDTSTFHELDAVLAPLLAGDLRSLVLDLAALEYISSAGVRCILKARKALAAHDGKVLVVSPQAQVRKVLDVVKAIPTHAIFASTAEADAYLDAMQRKVLRGDGDG